MQEWNGFLQRLNAIMHLRCLGKCPPHGKYFYHSIGDSKGASHLKEGYNFPKGKEFPNLEPGLSKMCGLDS